MTVVRGEAARRLIARSRRAALPPPVPPQCSWSVTWLAAYVHGITEEAAEFVSRELTKHDLPERIPDATALVRELVDNGRRHGRGKVLTTLSLATDGRLTLEVSDEGRVTPALQDATRRGSVEHSRSTNFVTPGVQGAGLKLVALLSQAWGIRETGEGKVVWAQLHDHDINCRGCHVL
jgi:hypothetical protein